MAVKNIDRDHLNIALGLRLARTLLVRSGGGQLFLLSDGQENSGDARAESEAAESNGVRISTLKPGDLAFPPDVRVASMGPFVIVWHEWRDVATVRPRWILLRRADHAPGARCGGDQSFQGVRSLSVRGSSHRTTIAPILTERQAAYAKGQMAIGVVLLAAALGPAGVCAPRFAERRHAGSADRSCQEQETPGWMFPLPHDAGRICLPANPARRHVLASNRRQCSYCWLCPSPPRSPSGTNSRPVGFTNPIATGVIVPVVSSTVPTKLATPESFGVSV